MQIYPYFGEFGRPIAYIRALKGEVTEFHGKTLYSPRGIEVVFKENKHGEPNLNYHLVRFGNGHMSQGGPKLVEAAIGELSSLEELRKSGFMPSTTFQPTTHDLEILDLNVAPDPNKGIESAYKLRAIVKTGEVIAILKPPVGEREDNAKAFSDARIVGIADVELPVEGTIRTLRMENDFMTFLRRLAIPAGRRIAGSTQFKRQPTLDELGIESLKIAEGKKFNITDIDSFEGMTYENITKPLLYFFLMCQNYDFGTPHGSNRTRYKGINYGVESSTRERKRYRSIKIENLDTNEEIEFNFSIDYSSNEVTPDASELSAVKIKSVFSSFFEE